MRLSELSLQVLRYGEGQRYKPHMDSNGRMCTLLIYLSGARAWPPVPYCGHRCPTVRPLSRPAGLVTVARACADTAEGGETAFPKTTNANYLDPSYVPDQAAASECARGHIHVRPRRGTALLFYSLPLDAAATQDLETVDPFSLHTGCPPTKGLKWTGTVWVHTKPFRPEGYTEAFKPPLPDPAVCGNFHEKCEQWASALPAAPAGLERP